MKQYRITSKDVLGTNDMTIPDCFVPDDDPMWDMITADSDAPSSIIKTMQEIRKGKE